MTPELAASAMEKNNAKDIRDEHCLTLGDRLLSSRRFGSESPPYMNGKHSRILAQQDLAKAKSGHLSPVANPQTPAVQFDSTLLLRGCSAVKEEVIAAYSANTPEMEAIRRLRNTLVYANNDDAVSHKVLAIVGPKRNEGRSTLLANLAVSCSQLGLTTLVIDADFHAPKQHVLFGLTNQCGLSAILAEQLNTTCLEQAVPGLDKLWVLPAGERPPNPHDLVGRQIFKKYLAAARSQYSIVLIDTPAFQNVDDAKLISCAAQSALMVVRSNVSNASQVRNMVKEFSTAHVTLLGSVLNIF